VYRLGSCTHGRRARTLNLQTGTIEYYGYGQDGRLLQDWSNRRQVRNGYVYLGNTLVGLYEVNLTNGTVTPKYQHTDALGSPVVTTNAGKTVLSRMSYTPYGLPTLPMDGVGYTGHFMDVGTQLTYMQQRYYDPQMARFYSIDPVAANSGDTRQFTRYAYAYNNPLLFADPDGRLPSIFDALKNMAAKAQEASRAIQKVADVTLEAGIAAGPGIQIEVSLLSGKGSIGYIPFGEGSYVGVMVKPKVAEFTIHKGDGAQGNVISQGGGRDVKGLDLERGNAKAGALVAAGGDLNVSDNGDVSIQGKVGLGIGELISGPAVTITSWEETWDGSK
jgi:RHS repeat-associated protein